VDRLAERGFARRTEDLHDRRIARLEATENGAAVLERLAAGQGDVIRDILAQLGPTELATVGAAFDVLHAGLQRTTQTTSDTLPSPQGTQTTSDPLLTPPGTRTTSDPLLTPPGTRTTSDTLLTPLGTTA
jgi:hypothetical protein